jgi:hypothetical protein
VVDGLSGIIGIILGVLALVGINPRIWFLLR